MHNAPGDRCAGTERGARLESGASCRRAERARRFGWLLCGLFVLCLGLQPMAARAEAGESAVVIVRVPGDQTIISRLRAELSSYRFRAIELADRPARRSEALSQLALQRDAQAALRAKPDAMAVELWVRAAGGTVQASEELVNAGPARDPELLAVRVTEAMRARGLTLPPLVAAASNPGSAPAAASGGQGTGPSGTGRATVPAANADVDVAEPHTLQPGELTEPVVKSADAVKGAAALPVKPAAPATPAKPIEAPQLPARAEPKLPNSDTEDKTRPAQKPEETQRPPQKIAETQRATPENEETQRAPEMPAEKQRAQKPEHKPLVQDSKPLPGAPEPNEVATASAFTRARDALVYLEVGPAGVLSPGPDRLGPALDLLVSLTFRPYQTSSISLVGLIPLLATDLSIEGGSVDVRTYGIGGFGDLHLPLGRVELSAGLGGLALISTGLVSPEFVSEYKTQRLAALLGRVGASMALTSELHVSASIMAGLTVQQLRLQFSTAEDASTRAPDATWGWPLLLGSLSIEIALPWDR